MGDELTPRGGSRLSRSQRENRGYQLVVAGGIAGAIFVVGAVLAVVGVLGWGLPMIALIVAVVCGFMFQRLARSR